MTNWTELTLEFDQQEVIGIPSGLKDEDQSIEIEIVDYSLYPDNSIKKIKIGFLISIPSLGYKTLQLVRSDKINLETIVTHDTNFKNKEYDIEINRENAKITVSKIITRITKKYRILMGNEICLDEEIEKYSIIIEKIWDC